MTPVVPWPFRPPRRVAGIPVGLLVCWQVALLLALVAIGRPAGYVIGCGVAAALVVAVTGLRPRGRWAHEWLVLWVRYLWRRQLLAATRYPDPAQAVLDATVQLETVTEVEVDGETLAVMAHGYGCTGVLELDPAADLARLPQALAPPNEPDAPTVSVQLLVHTTVATAVRAWLAVRVHADAAYTMDHLEKVLVGAVRRLRRRLAADGVAVQALDRERLGTTVRALLRLDLPAPAGAPEVAAGTEQWRAWWTRYVPQETVAVRSWPGVPNLPSGALLAALFSPRSPQTVSIAAERIRLPTGYGALQAGEQVVALEMLVRVAAHNRSALDAAARHLVGRLTGAGASVERLDGRQLPALAATLPVGGFLPGYRPSMAGFAPAPDAASVARSAPPPPARPQATPLPPAPALPARNGRGPTPGSAVPATIDAARASVPVQPAGPAVRASAPAAEAPAPAGRATVPARASVPVPVALPGQTPARGRAPVSPPPAGAQAMTSPPPAGAQATSPPPAGAQAMTSPPPAGAQATSPPPAGAQGMATPPPAQMQGVANPPAGAAQQPAPNPAPRLVSVVAGEPRLGAGDTAAGLAWALAAGRDGYTVVDVTAQPGGTAAQTLAASARVVVVTGADRRATRAFRLALDRIGRVRTDLVEGAVLATVCRSDRQYRRLVRRLGRDPGPQAARIVPIPPDPGQRTDAYLRLAATVAGPAASALTRGGA